MILVIDIDVCRDGISPHFSTDYIKLIYNIHINISNCNQNSLSTLSVNYICYFYLYYQKLIKFFPNLLYSNYLRFVYILNKYIIGSLSRFQSNILYLSCISSSFSSHISNIRSLTSLIPQFEGLINSVFGKLKSAIGLNISLLCLKISNIDKSIKCCHCKLREGINIISSINKLIHTECKKGIVDCFKKCLYQITCKFIELEIELCNLYHSYCYIISLENEALDIINCNNQISSLKSKICDLKSKFECGIADFKAIECYINYTNCIIIQLKEFKQKSCKQFDKIRLLMCITDSSDRFKIVIINASAVKKKIECLTGKIDEICSEFTNIEDNTTDLKHSLMFNVHYLQISSYILEQLECIDSQQKELSSKLSSLKEVPSGISVITDNINFLKSLIEKMNERRDDPGYLMYSIKFINIKLCEIKESAKQITSKSTELQCVVQSLHKIKSSIEKLKKLEHDRVCLEIFEFTVQFALIRTLVCIRDKLEIRSLTDKLDTFRNGISSLESVICNTKNLLGYIEKILSDMKWIVRWIDEVDKWLDNVIKRFIGCSLLSLTNHSTVRVINNNLVDDQIYGLYSLTNVNHYNEEVNRLFECSKKIDQILQLNINIYWCKCIHELHWTTGNSIDLRYINIKKIIEVISSKNNNDDLNLKKIKRLTQDDIKDNHFCLCMIFKYILYPQIINLTYLMSKDLQTLSTISRKYDSYTQTYFKDLSQFFIVCVELLYKLSLYILLKFKYSWTVGGGRVDIKCFCTYSHDPSYYSVISLILVMSSLIENLWSMDPKTIRMSIEKISSLTTEFDKIDSQNNKSIINMNIFKLSFVSALSSSTQSCRILAKLRIIIDLVSLSNKVRVLESFIRRYIVNISLCNIFRFENVLKQLKQYFKDKANTEAYLNWVLKQYESVNGSCSGCNNSNCCSICLNLLIFWIWMYICLKVNIKLYESNKEYKERLTNLLNCICSCGEDCCCKELKAHCDKICGTNCRTDCVCTKLKTEIQKICNGGSGNCGGDCLCKQIDKTIGKCFEKGTCECKNKGCCKVVAQSVRLLGRACRANVLDPYKRITLDLLNCGKNKDELMRSIVKGINESMVNRIYLVKNNLLTHPNYDITVNPLNTEKSRNWGYDTHFEHYVTTLSNHKLSP